MKLFSFGFVCSTLSNLHLSAVQISIFLQYRKRNDETLIYYHSIDISKEIVTRVLMCHFFRHVFDSFMFCPAHKKHHKNAVIRYRGRIKPCLIDKCSYFSNAFFVYNTSASTRPNYERMPSSLA